MLPIKHRLTTEKDFRRIKFFGQSFFSSWFTLKRANNNLSWSRFGVIASTKVSKKASDRNRIKRQVREMIRLNLENIKSGYDIVIIIKNRALGHDYTQLESDLLSILAKARLLK